ELTPPVGRRKRWLGHPQWTRHWPGHPLAGSGWTATRRRRAGVPTPAGHADPAERRRTNFTYGPSPGRAFARLVVNRADELGDTPSANRALYVIPTAARHGRAAEAAPVCAPRWRHPHGTVRRRALRVRRWRDQGVTDLYCALMTRCGGHTSSRRFRKWR